MSIADRIQATPSLDDDLRRETHNLDTRSFVNWAAQTYGETLALACSFGAEDVVLMDLLAKSPRKVTTIVLDTGRLHQETYDVMDRIRRRYGVEFQVFQPQTTSLQNLLSAKGPNSFYGSIDNRHECCEIRKIEPLRRALAGRPAWMTGLRRTQSVTRTELPRIEIDSANGGLLKLNPLADWEADQVWDYIREHDVPHNALHAQGYPSIGCAPCTRAIQPGEDLRAGRWWWERPEQKECGLHRR